MSDIFSKLMKNLKKEEFKKNETMVKLPTDKDNKVIKYLKARNIDYVLEIEDQDNFKKQENEGKEFDIEKERQDRLMKQEKKRLLKYATKFEELYNNQEISETIKERLTHLKAHLADIFLLYYFHFNNLEKIKDIWYLESLSDFLKMKFQIFYSTEEIEKMAKEKFLYLKNVRISAGNSSVINLSFFNNICLSTDLMHNGTTLDVWSPYYFLNSSIEQRKPNEYEVFYSNFYYLYLEEKNKQKFVDYFNKVNELTLSDIHDSFDKLEINLKNLDGNVLIMIKNFVKEVPEEFMLNPDLYIHLEYFIALYRFGESIVESSFNKREMTVDWSARKNQESIQLAKRVKVDFFDKLNFILKDKIDIEEDLIPALVWLEFRHQAKNYYSFKWIEEYGIYFKSIDLNMDNILHSYCSINEIDSLDEKNISYLTYYLMSLGFFDDNTLFLTNHKMISEEIEEIIKQMELVDFEQRLMKTPKTKNNDVGFDDLDLMTGIEFEFAIAELFKKMGFFAVITKTSGDQGIDIIAEKEGKKFGIQTKCYSSKISNTAIQETAAGIVYYECDKGIVVTNNYFTSSAIELAEKNNIILWNRDMLKEKFKKFMAH